MPKNGAAAQARKSRAAQNRLDDAAGRKRRHDCTHGKATPGALRGKHPFGVRNALLCKARRGHKTAAEEAAAIAPLTAKEQRQCHWHPRRDVIKATPPVPRSKRNMDEVLDAFASFDH